MEFSKQARALLAVLTIGSLVAGVPNAVGAQESTLPQPLISEVMYHPTEDPDDGDQPDVDNFEFIELYNPGPGSVTLDGMSWVSGVEGSLPNLTMGEGSFALFSPDPEAFALQYGFPPDGSYEKKLSNGGEKLAIGVIDGPVFDEVEYDDKFPWPITPDGKGPALELIDLTDPGRGPERWQASAPGGSPGQGPTVATGAVSEVEVGPNEEPDQPVTVSALIAGSSGPELVYRVGFGPERRMPMDGGSEAWAGRIPGAPAGSLVRFRIETGSDDATHPPADSGLRYDGYVVPSPQPATDVARIQVFIEDSDYEEMVGDSRFDRDRLFPAVVAYDGVVYDGVQMQVRGGNWARTNFPKQSFNVEFPDGKLFDAPDLFDYPVDEFALQSEWIDDTKGRANASWFLFEEQGFDGIDTNFAYVERNGEFYGVYRIGEKLDGVWRDNHGWGDNNFYKADGGWSVSDGFDQKEGDEDHPILDQVRTILDRGGDARTAELYDTLDIPNLINYVALSLLTDHNDQYSHNFYVGHDLDDTGRVSLHPWDVDWTWRRGILRCRGNDLTEPGCMDDRLMDALWTVPEFRAAVYRRIRSMLDQTVSTGVLEQRHRDHIDAVGAEAWGMEFERWGRSEAVSRISEFEASVKRRLDLFDDLSEVPSSQDSSAGAVISEIHYNPADDGPEILELANPGSTSLDLSGWEIKGVGLTIPYGTVIPPLGRIVFTDQDRAFRAMYPGLKVIVVQHPGGLKGGGETVTLLNKNGDVVDVVSYLDEDPWPEEPDSGVFSLELTDLAADNNDPSNWMVSQVAGGTPGRGPDNQEPMPTEADVRLRARGSTGTELIELRHGSTVLQTFALTDEFASYRLPVADDQLDRLKVAFINNALVSAGDRNVYLDYLQVDDERVQAEDPEVQSLGHYSDGSCGLGFKLTEKLHCDGYFDFSDLFKRTTPPTPPTTVPPTVPPTTVPPTTVPPTTVPPSGEGTEVEVEAAGQIGGEEIELRINGVVVATKTLSKAGDFFGSGVSYQQLRYRHPGPVSGKVQVAFTNNAIVDGEDRNVRIDHIRVGDSIYQAEDPSVVGTGVWRNGGRCDPGNWSSEFLHCNGTMTFMVGSGTPPTTTPTTGPPTTTPPTTVPPTTGPPTSMPPTTPTTGSTTKVVVDAVGQVGGEKIELLINGEVVADKTLDEAPDFKSKTVAYEQLTYVHPEKLESSAAIRVRFTNNAIIDGRDLNVRIDGIKLDGIKYESEDPSVSGTGVWKNGGRCELGNWSSEFVNCNGYLEFTGR